MLRVFAIFSEMSFAFTKVTSLAFRQAVVCCILRVIAVQAYITLLVLLLFFVGLPLVLELSSRIDGECRFCLYLFVRFLARLARCLVSD